jgi:hypothetical protein
MFLDYLRCFVVVITVIVEEWQGSLHQPLDRGPWIERRTTNPWAWILGRHGHERHLERVHVGCAASIVAFNGGLAWGGLGGCT